MAQDAENRLITAFRKQNEKIIYFCSAENISPNVAVHEIRKSFKRIRALLKFYSECSVIFPRILIDELKAIGKILSPIRESFVNVQIFERVTEGNYPVSERKIKRVKELLSEKNKTETGAEFVEKEVCNSISMLTEKFESELEQLAIECPSSKQIKEQLSVSFLVGYELFKEIETGFTAEKLHKLRKILKRLWYQIDFIKFLHPRYFRLKSDQLNKITEQLGDDHDLFVFNQQLQLPEFKLLTDELLMVENLVEHQRELNMLKLTPRLKHFFNEPPEIFDRKLEKIFKIH